MPKGSEHQSWTNMGQSSDPLDDYKLRAALEGTHCCRGENRHGPKIELCFSFITTRQLAKQLYPFKLYRHSVQGGTVDSNSYCTNAQTPRDGASQVTDPSPGLTTCDTERRSPSHPPSGSRPRDDISACGRVPHSDNYTAFRWGKPPLGVASRSEVSSQQK